MTGKGEEVVRRLARAGHDLAGYEWLFDQGSLTDGPPAVAPTPMSTPGSRRPGLYLPIAGWVTASVTVENIYDVVETDLVDGGRNFRNIPARKQVRIKATLPAHLFEGSPPILDPNSTNVHDLIIITGDDARIDAKAFISAWDFDIVSDTVDVEFLVSGEPVITLPAAQA